LDIIPTGNRWNNPQPSFPEKAPSAVSENRLQNFRVEESEGHKKRAQNEGPFFMVSDEVELFEKGKDKSLEGFRSLLVLSDTEPSKSRYKLIAGLGSVVVVSGATSARGASSTRGAGGWIC